MPLEIQSKLASKEGVSIKDLYAMNRINWIPMVKIAEQMETVGSENVVLETDMGQIDNPSSSKTMKIFVEKLTQRGLKQEDIRRMAVENPRNILDLETES